MSSFPILDLVVGLIFVYFLLSVFCSSAVEMILTVQKVRAKVLEKWLYTIFDKEITQPDGKKLSLGQAIMDHCSITALSKPGESPSYIDAKNFTSALIEKITFDPANPKSIASDLNSIIEKIQNSHVLSTEYQRVLLSYAFEARDSVEALREKGVSEVQLFRSKVETWFNSSMDRLTGYLKQTHLRPITIGAAIVASLLLNADSISIAKYLYNNPEARAKVATQAYNISQDTLKRLTKNIDDMKGLRDSATVKEFKATLKTGLDNMAEAKAAVEENIPLGWNEKVFKNSEGNFSFWLALSKLVGLAATVLAIVMGAPFWFDMLNKISNLRGAGPKPSTATSDDNSDNKTGKS